MTYVEITEDYLAGALDASARVAYGLSSASTLRLGYRANPELSIYNRDDPRYLGLWDEFLEDHGFRHSFATRDGQPAEIRITRTDEILRFSDQFESSVVQLLRPLALFEQLEFSSDGVLADEDSFLRLLKTIEAQEPYLRDYGRRSITFESVRDEFGVFGGVEPYAIDVPTLRTSLSDEYLAGYFDQTVRYRISVGTTATPLGYNAHPVIHIQKGRIHPLTIDMITTALAERDIHFNDQSETYYLELLISGYSACQEFLDCVHEHMLFSLDDFQRFNQHLLPFFEEGVPTDEQQFYELICVREKLCQFSGRDRKYTPEYFAEEFDVTDERPV
jgi:hypothetical protein